MTPANSGLSKMAPCAEPCTSEGSLSGPLPAVSSWSFGGPEGRPTSLLGHTLDYLAGIWEGPAQWASPGLFPRSLLPRADLSAGVCCYAWGTWAGAGGWVGVTQGRMECECSRAPSVHGKTRLGEWSALPRSPRSKAELETQDMAARSRWSS